MGKTPKFSCKLLFSFLDFDNHIFVTTDAEAFFFLHDLISSYLKEKERVLSIQQKTLESYHNHNNDKTQSSTRKPKTDDLTNSSSGANSEKSSSIKDQLKHNIDPLHNDWRRFECNTWHLEPTVRLISTFGSQIEPYGVDLILSKLGFSHARITIPKWLQRGCMDPMDKIMSLIVLKIIQSVKEDPKTNRPNEDHFSASGGKSTSGSAQNSNNATNNSSIPPYYPMSAMTETPSKDKVSKMRKLR